MEWNETWKTKMCSDNTQTPFRHLFHTPVGKTRLHLDAAAEVVSGGGRGNSRSRGGSTCGLYKKPKWISDGVNILVLTLCAGWGMGQGFGEWVAPLAPELPNYFDYYFSIGEASVYVSICGSASPFCWNTAARFTEWIRSPVQSRGGILCLLTASDDSFKSLFPLLRDIRMGDARVLVWRWLFLPGNVSDFQCQKTRLKK